MNNNIFIRSGVTPFLSNDYQQIITNNSIGNNIGNLIYAFSVYKTLCTNNEINFIATYKSKNFTSEEIDHINETCKYFIIPLADCLRSSFVHTMQGYTELIKQLKIPCVIIGMGVRAPYNFEKDFHYPFDDTVKDFISAVLDKSSTVGVRGEITADYLSRIGFKRDKHVTVIGCPSMYLHGGNLKIKDKQIDKNSFVSYSSHVRCQPRFTNYLHKQATQFKNYVHIPQTLEELEYIYYGKKLNVDKVLKNALNDMYLSEHCQFFYNVASWFEFLEKVDFSFGLRLHGSIASLLAGNPTLFFSHDARQKEVADFHKIPNIPVVNVKEGTNILDLIKNIDFHSIEKTQQENFQNYLNFLRHNNVQNFWEQNKGTNNELFNRRLKQDIKFPLLKPHTMLSKEERIKRIISIKDIYYQNILEKIFSIKKSASGEHKIITILGHKFKTKIK